MKSYRTDHLPDLVFKDGALFCTIPEAIYLTKGFIEVYFVDHIEGNRVIANFEKLLFCQQYTVADDFKKISRHKYGH